jgi:hypothetical protein
MPAGQLRAIHPSARGADGWMARCGADAARSTYLEPQMSCAVHHMLVRFAAQLFRLERAQQQAMFNLRSTAGDV